MTIFDVFFAIGWIGSLLLDYSIWNKNNKKKDVNKPLYLCLNAITLALFVSHVANIRITMPTQLLARNVAPWIKSMIGGMFNG
ncbi:hypothetical protein SD71_21090 [Cohnella kolymensis]|uniref:Uncharacterized protein n=1 Tax=Cohnella kolymensis TaxID=1590652 RepID=A0ABR4ZZC7_9BACL|nr:hypothetical protein [Cohnella kolymensis]KIL34169.1 hypothetical protein SD71_21090 [Cohnella kolymensis]